MSVESLFGEIQEAIQESDFQTIIEVSDKVLQAIPDDSDALKCKLKALVQLGKYEDALKLFESFDSLKQNCQFEHAYCLYQTDQLEQSTKVLNAIEKETVFVQALKAQVAFNKADFNLSIEIYESLLNSNEIDEEELKTNLLASYVAAERLDDARKFIDNNPDSLRQTFEFIFNAACVELIDEQYEKANSLLNDSENLCKLSGEKDELTKEEIEDELIVIQTQKMFISQVTNEKDSKEIESFYKQCFEKTKNTNAVYATASNNNVALNDGSDLFLSLRQLKHASTVAARLLPQARAMVALNKALILLKMSKSNEALAIADQLELDSKILSKKAQETLLITSYRIKIACASNDNEKSLSLIEEALKKFPNSSILRVLSAQTQLNTVKDDSDNKTALLSSINQLEGIDNSNKPALLGALTELRARQSSGDEAANVLLKALKSNQISDSAVRGAGDYLVVHNRASEAATLFEGLLKKSRGRDARATALLVVALADIDAKRAAELSSGLPDISPSSSFDVNATLAEGIGNTQSLAAMAGAMRAGGINSDNVTAAAQASAQVDAERLAKKRALRKKQRKKRFPKGFDPENPSAFPKPDPERWIPKKLRKSNRKNQKNNDRGAQGGGKVEKNLSGSAQIHTQHLKGNQNKPKGKGGKKGGKKKGRR